MRDLLDRWRGVAFAMVLAVTATGQMRRPLVGRVTLTGGAPAAGAVVTLITRAWIGIEERPDVRTVQTDRDGVFSTRLLAGAGYSVWASRPEADAPDRCRVSAVMENVAAGQSPVLVLGEPQQRPPLRFAGKREGVFGAGMRVQLLPDVDHAAPFDLAADGRAPALPPVVAALLSRADGSPLCVLPVHGSDQGLLVELPVIDRLRLRVLDGAGEVLPDARVVLRQSLRPRIRLPRLFEVPWPQIDIPIGARVGGELHLEWPRAKGEPLLFAPGREPLQLSHGQLQHPPDEDQPITMQPAPALMITPADVGLVQVRATYLHQGFTAAAIVDVHPVTGRLELPFVARPVESLVAPYGHGDGRPVRAGEVRAPGFLRVPWSPGAATPVAFDRQRRVEVTVVDPTGQPVVGAAGVVVPDDCWSMSFHAAPVFTGDGGNFTCFVGPEPWTVAFFDGNRGCLLRVPGRGEVAATTMMLADLPVARVRLSREPWRLHLMTAVPQAAVGPVERLRVLFCGYHLARLVVDGRGHAELPMLPGELPLLVNAAGLPEPVALRVSRGPDDRQEF